jgi:hypothetical protein
MAINPFGNLPPLLQEDPLTKIQQSTLAFGEQPKNQGNPYSPVANEGLRNAYLFGMIPSASPQEQQEQQVFQGDGTPSLPEMQLAPGMMSADIYSPYSDIVEKAKFDQTITPSGDPVYSVPALIGAGKTLQDITGFGGRTPMQILRETTSVRGIPFVGEGVQYTPSATSFSDTTGESVSTPSAGLQYDEEGAIVLNPAVSSAGDDAAPKGFLQSILSGPEKSGDGTVLREVQAESPQATFLARKEKGPLSDYEVEQANLYAASMGTTFDPETGYGQKGSAPVMDRGVAATQQALLRQFGAPTISQIQELDRIDRERQRGPEQPLDEREQRMVQQQQLRKAFGGNVPSRLIGQTGQIEAPTSADIPSEISEIMLKPAQMRTDDERNRLARFGRSSMGQAIGGLSGLEAAMLSPAERAAAAAKATQANLTTQTKQVQLESAKLELDQLRNPQVDPVKATQINASLESLGVDRIGEGGLTIDRKGNLRTPTQKLKPGSAEYNRAVNLLNQTAGGRAILSSIGLNTFPEYSVDKPL